MNRTLGIALCSSVICTSLFSAEAPAPSALPTPTPSADPLAVPPVKPWIKRAQEVKDPEVVTILKGYTGQEKEGERFHDIPSNRRLLSEHLEGMMRTLQDVTVNEVESFLLLCEQRGVQVEFEASADLFSLAFHNRVKREMFYKNNITVSVAVSQKKRLAYVGMLKEEIERLQKEAEQQTLLLSGQCKVAKDGHEPYVKMYTNIMRLTQKLNPQFTPPYATNPALYYDDIERQLGLKMKLEEQAELAKHTRELAHLHTLVKQFGTLTEQPRAIDNSNASATPATVAPTAQPTHQ